MKKGTNSLRILFVALFLSLFLGTSVFADTEYDVTGIGTPGAWTQAVSINNNGQVVGLTAYGNENNYYPIYWDKNSSLQSLPSIGRGIGMGINDSGYIVGREYIGDSHYGVYWDQDKNMHFLYPGGRSVADGINNANQAVGFYGGPPYAVTWPNIASNSIQDLGFPASSWANGINDNGQIVGRAGGENAFYGFLYDHGSIKVLPSLSGARSCAQAINNLGQAVGVDYGMGALIWDQQGVAQYLGSIGGWTYALGINDSTQVVGRDYTMGKAFIWDATNGIKDLNTLIDPSLGWVLDYAYDINNSGQIVGFGYLNGTQYGFLLTPKVVPEPASFLLFGLGGAAIGILKRKKKV